jgi:hypothetical protein
MVRKYRTKKIELVCARMKSCGNRRWQASQSGPETNSIEFMNQTQGEKPHWELFEWFEIRNVRSHNEEKLIEQ